MTLKEAIEEVLSKKPPRSLKTEEDVLKWQFREIYLRGYSTGMNNAFEILKNYGNEKDNSVQSSMR